MKQTETLILLAVMILTTNLIRVLPVTIIRRKITNRFLRSFLYYVPYVTLAVMTVPSIFESAASPLAGMAALIAGIIAAWLGCNLLPVAVICCVVAFICGMI